MYYKKNLQSLAVPAFEKALKAEPNNAVFHYHLGAAYAAAGDKLKAAPVALAGDRLEARGRGRGASEVAARIAALVSVRLKADLLHGPAEAGHYEAA